MCYVFTETRSNTLKHTDVSCLYDLCLYDLCLMCYVPKRTQVLFLLPRSMYLTTCSISLFYTHSPTFCMFLCLMSYVYRVFISYVYRVRLICFVFLCFCVFQSSTEKTTGIKVILTGLLQISQGNVLSLRYFLNRFRSRKMPSYEETSTSV